MTQSLYQPSLDLSPASSPLPSRFGNDGEITIIPNTPTTGDRSSRNLLPIFSSRERERGSLSSEYLANQLPAWCTNGRGFTSLSRSHSLSESPGSSASSSVNSADNTLLKEILKEVQNSNKKVADLEKKLQDLQQAECSGGAKRKKIVPSPEVRMMVRKMFKTLEEEKEDFGWNIRVDFADRANQDVANMLVAEVKAHLPDVPSVTINEATRTYFYSVSGVSHLKSCGKYAKITRQRRKNRILRKLKRRQASFRNTTSLTPAQKETWASCVVAEMMSSEESDDEEDPNFVIRPLPWRSDKVNSFFDSLDRKFSKNQSRKSVMMTIHRSKGHPSDRLRPTNVPDWALKPRV